LENEVDHLKLQLTVDDLEAVWLIPATVTADDVETNLRLLKQYVDDPPSFEDGKSGADLLRRKVARKNYSDSEGLSSSDASDTESSGGPLKPSKKRKRKAADDAELDARREKRRLADMEKRAMIKSAAQILDSDDDEDADAEFFERERELRERMARKALEGGLPSSGTRKVGGPRKRAEKKRGVIGMKSEREGSVGGEIEVTAIEEIESSMSIDGVQDDQSENEDIDDLRHMRKRKVRHAISSDSDEEE